MFKVGDKVIATMSDDPYYCKGDIGVIAKDWEDGRYLVAFEPSPTVDPSNVSTWYISEINMKLVKIKVLDTTTNKKVTIDRFISKNVVIIKTKKGKLKAMHTRDLDTQC